MLMSLSDGEFVRKIAVSKRRIISKERNCGPIKRRNKGGIEYRK